MFNIKEIYRFNDKKKIEKNYYINKYKNIKDIYYKV